MLSKHREEEGKSGVWHVIVYSGASGRELNEEVSEGHGKAAAWRSSWLQPASRDRSAHWLHHTVGPCLAVHVQRLKLRRDGLQCCRAGWGRAAGEGSGQRCQ